MKYPVKGSIVKKYVTIEYVEHQANQKATLEYTKALSDANNGSLSLGGKDISPDIVMGAPLEEKEEPIIVIATRINFNANVTVKNNYSRQHDNKANQNDGSLHMSVPQLLYEIVEADGTPRLCYSSEIKFDVEELNKQL